MTSKSDHLEEKIETLLHENQRLRGFLRDAYKAAEIAVSAELDHGEYSSADRFRKLKLQLASFLDPV